MEYTSGGNVTLPTKVCTGCRKEFPATPDHFHRDRHANDGLQYQCKKCKIEVAHKWNTNNKERKNEARMRRKYGIGLIEYRAMQMEQGFKCKICGTHQLDLKVALAVDHCHTSGIIRGLLCTRCNTALGLFKEDVTLFNKAINYLKTAWRKKQ